MPRLLKIVKGRVVIMAATVKDIAARTGLGLATISKYLNGGTVREKNRVAIEAAVQELQFTVNTFARGLKTSRSRIVGVVIPELSNLFITSIITVLEDVLRKNGYGVFVCDCRTDEALEREAVQFLVNRMADGIISMPTTRDGSHLAPALEKGIPVVLVDRLLPDHIPADAVLTDNAGAGREAAGRLMDLGHRKIAILAGPKEVYTFRERLRGFREAYEARGLMPCEDLVLHGENTVEGGYAVMRALLAGNASRESPATAAFVTNYEMTLGAVIALNELGLKLPGELSLIGFDNLELSRLVRPPLTIMTQPMEEIGRQAAALMLERLAPEASSQKDGRVLEKRTVILPASLCPGGSIGPLG